MRYFDLLRQIYGYGQEVTSRGLKTLELRNVRLDVDNYNAVSVPVCRDWVDISKYLYAEMAWYMSGDRTLTKIMPYSKFWDQIKNHDGTANSNYGDLVFYRKNKRNITSFAWAFEQLVKDQYTRKAIVLYNDRDLFYYDNKDLICNQYQHFMIRNNTLECTIALRSSDAIYGLTFNMPWWSFVHQQMFLVLKKFYPDLILGPMVAFISSSHIYENKIPLVREMISSSEQEYRFLRLSTIVPLSNTFESYHSQFPEVFK